MRHLGHIPLNAAAALLLAGCSPSAQEASPVVLPQLFFATMSNSMTVEFDHDPRDLARTSDADFERLLAADRSAGTFLGLPPAVVDAAIEFVRRRRAEATHATSRPVGTAQPPSK